MWIGYCVLPILDYILPIDHENLSSLRVRKFEKDWRFLIPLYAIVFIDFGLYASILIRVSNGTIAKTWLDFTVYAVCAAQTGMINATVGHELFHRRERVHKVFGTLPYAKMLYAHFFV